MTAMQISDSRWGIRHGTCFVALLCSAYGCGAPGASSRTLAPVVDPTPGAKCRIAAGQDSPLVTEWTGSEKARLEGLAARQAIAVSYTGCELKVVEACRIPGRYAWRRTTLATDTIEIANADDLYARLPLGAIGLEAELARSGRIAVRTTVAGQFQLEAVPGALSADPACIGVTHLVTGISVGAFSLLSGGAVRGGGGVGLGGFGAGASSVRQESVVRQAGNPQQCMETTAESPHPGCGSPLQVFLSPVAAPVPSPQPVGTWGSQPTAREPSVHVEFPAPDFGELWSLHDPSGLRLCTLPCAHWIPARSGIYLERAPAGGKEVTRLELPNLLPHPAGSYVRAEYRAKRGEPFLSALTFWGVGVPAGAMSLVLMGFWAGTDSDSRRADLKGFFLGSAVMFASVFGGTAGWYFYSHSAKLETKPLHVGLRRTSPSVTWQAYPGGLLGTF